jgi:hypothetical protein
MRSMKPLILDDLTFAVGCSMSSKPKQLVGVRIGLPSELAPVRGAYRSFMFFQGVVICGRTYPGAAAASFAKPMRIDLRRSTVNVRAPDSHREIVPGSTPSLAARAAWLMPRHVRAARRRAPGGAVAS